MKIQVIVNRALVIGGREYTPESGVVDLPDEVARDLQAAGLLRIVEESRTVSEVPAGLADYDLELVLKDAVSPGVVDKLREAGYLYLSDADRMTEESLTKIRGIGLATARKILFAVKG